jgi:hypothetical protein
MNRRCFMSCLSRGGGSPSERPPGNLIQLWMWMFRRWWRSSWSLTTIQTGCARCDLFESSHGKVLCDATNEASVSDMLCRDNKEVCKHCKKESTVLGTRDVPRRKQSQANPLTVVNLCLILSGAHRGHRTSLAIPLDRYLFCLMINSVG